MEGTAEFGFCVCWAIKLPLRNDSVRDERRNRQFLLPHGDVANPLPGEVQPLRPEPIPYIFTTNIASGAWRRSRPYASISARETNSGESLGSADSSINLFRISRNQQRFYYLPSFSKNKQIDSIPL